MRVRQIAASISLVAAGLWIVALTYFGQAFGWPAVAILMTLGVCQCLALGPHVIPKLGGRFETSSVMVRTLAVASCVAASVVAALGSLSRIRHHGLLGFVDPTSMSGFIDEAGVFHTMTPSMTISELSLSVLFVTAHLWGGIAIIRGKAKRKN